MVFWWTVSKSVTSSSTVVARSSRALKCFSALKMQTWKKWTDRIIRRSFLFCSRGFALNSAVDNLRELWSWGLVLSFLHLADKTNTAAIVAESHCTTIVTLQTSTEEWKGNFRYLPLIDVCTKLCRIAAATTYNSLPLPPLLTGSSTERPWTEGRLTWWCTDAFRPERWRPIHWSRVQPRPGARRLRRNWCHAPNHLHSGRQMVVDHS